MLAFLLRVMAPTEELNVTAACREMEIRRTLFCRWRRRFEQQRRKGLHTEAPTPPRSAFPGFTLPCAGGGGPGAG